jgi:hypothetical protein
LKSHLASKQISCQFKTAVLVKKQRLVVGDCHPPIKAQRQRAASGISRHKGNIMKYVIRWCGAVLSTHSTKDAAGAACNNYRRIGFLGAYVDRVV